MKFLLVFAATLLPATLANGFGFLMTGVERAGGGAGLELSARGQGADQEFFMEEVRITVGVDFTMLAVAPRGDREYFIQTPPMPGPDMSERLERGLDWLRDLDLEGSSLERFDMTPLDSSPLWPSGRGH